jgi:hypothetical protein
MNLNVAFAMTNFLELCYNVFILKNKIGRTNVQKKLYQFVLYHVENSINLCQYGEGFLLVFPSFGRPMVEFEHMRGLLDNLYLTNYGQKVQK